MGGGTGGGGFKLPNLPEKTGYDPAFFSGIDGMDVLTTHRSTGGMLHAELRLGQVAFSPAQGGTQRNSKMVSTRGYNGKMVGPVLRVSPGDHLSITLHNTLASDGPDVTSASPNGFHSPNTTSLHVHGMHVSPR